MAKRKKSVQEQMAEILADFVNEEQEVIEGAFNEAATLARNTLRETSPKDRGDYARSWTITRPSKRVKGVTFGSFGITVYNKKHYRLTHLLERSHVIKNQYGTYGRSKPQPHIGKAEEVATNELMRNLENML